VLAAVQRLSGPHPAAATLALSARLQNVWIIISLSTHQIHADQRLAVTPYIRRTMSCFQMICPTYAASPAPAAYLLNSHPHDYRSPFSAEEYRNWSPKVSFTHAGLLNFNFNIQRVSKRRHFE